MCWDGGGVVRERLAEAAAVGLEPEFGAARRRHRRVVAVVALALKRRAGGAVRARLAPQRQYVRIRFLRSSI